MPGVPPPGDQIVDTLPGTVYNGHVTALTASRGGKCLSSPGPPSPQITTVDPGGRLTVTGIPPPSVPTIHPGSGSATTVPDTTCAAAGSTGISLASRPHPAAAHGMSAPPGPETPTRQRVDGRPNAASPAYVRCTGPTGRGGGAVARTGRDSDRIPADNLSTSDRSMLTGPRAPHSDTWGGCTWNHTGRASAVVATSCTLLYP